MKDSGFPLRPQSVIKCGEARTYAFGLPIPEYSSQQYWKSLIRVMYFYLVTAELPLLFKLQSLLLCFLSLVRLKVGFPLFSYCFTVRARVGGNFPTFFQYCVPSSLALFYHLLSVVFFFLVAMRVVVIGHSYVKYLERLGGWDNVVELLDNGDRVDFPGKDFSHFLENPTIFERVKRYNPEVVITILGGNAITNLASNNEIKVQAKDYFELKKDSCGENCLRLAVQIERRFASENNKFDVPQEYEYNQRRSVLNNYLNKTIRKGSGLIHNVINLGGDAVLNNPEHFYDGVHLKIEGLMIYKQMLINGLVYALNHCQ